MDKASKKHWKKVISWAALALVVLLLTVMPLLAKQEAEEDGPQASILTGTVEKGTISTTLHGGGTLSMNTPEDVTLPSGVKITEFLVKNDDVVSQGDPVALVDKVSVMTAIVEVKETMEYLAEEIEDVRYKTLDTILSATAGGRVKKVYAQAGDSVQDVMLEHGALALLSLDGMMAVQVQRDMALATGDSVLVTLADGTEVDGRVESKLDGVITVTVEDEGYEMGQTVTITTEEGDKVGEGALYVHNAWKATAFTGTIASVYGKEETEITAGSTLFSLSNTKFTAEMEHLSNQHREYEELMRDLFQMYETGYLEAPCDGIVSGVDRDSEFLLAAGDTEWEARLLTAPQERGWTVMLLSSGESGNDTPGEDGGEDEEGTETGNTAYTGYIAQVTQVSKPDNKIWVKVGLSGTAITKQEDGTWDFGTMDFANPGNLLPFEDPIPVGNAAEYRAGDTVVLAYDENYNCEVILVAEASSGGDDTGSQFPGGMGGMGGFPSFDFSGLLGGMMGGMSGYTGGAAAAEETVELFDLEGEVLMTVTPQDKVSLTITLDEQDIAKVSVGLTAQVKVEAIRGQTFEAEVVQVGTTGTNNGGSSKFTARLELPYSDQMLDGMSATASLPLATRVDVLTIPVKALAQEGPKTVVYTSQDKESGELTGPVEVTTGLSDGTTAELLSGLEMGDAYYYSYYDILELDTSVNTQKYTFG